ncbi:MAG: T9SS type A sorting domain-containing protein [Rhodothermia bacterium]|nr:T9SS type A sorting domain-containing protein [Rhodothermia bacterium]
MRFISISTLLLLVTAGTGAAQLSGDYTVGGDSPDFFTLQAAADQLLAVGVSGPVNILVRPGEYVEAGGSVRVLDLDSDIAGTSPLTRVRFAPDRASGATNTNVLLRRSSGAGEDGYIVQIKSNHTTVEGFTIELADTAATVAAVPSLVYLEAASDSGVDNMIIDGLGGRRAWRCIMMINIENDVFATNNQITDCIEAIYQSNHGGPRADRLRITGNHMTGMSTLAERRDSEYGLHIRLDSGGEDVVVSNNVLDFRGASGINGIGLVGAGPKERLRVERNQVIGLDLNLGSAGVGNLLQVSEAPGGLIANNILSGDAYLTKGAYLTMNQNSDSLTFAHNTVRVGGSSCYALQVDRDNRFPSFIRVVDNILVSEGNCANSSYQHMNYTFTNSSNAEIDYNIHSFISNVPLAIDNVGGSYLDLPAWQAAGFGEHSLFQRPEFADEPSDLHLGECAFEDETLRGTPLLEVPLDIDSQGRDSQAPFIGADEPSGAPPSLFDGPEVYVAGTGSFQFDSGDLDGDGDIDIVVTNPGSAGGGSGDNDVTVLYNNGNGIFGAPSHVEFGVDPNNIRIGEINNRGTPDLAVRGDDGVWVRFGVAGTSFTNAVQVGSLGTSDLELADYDNDGDTDIFVVSSTPGSSSSIVVYINQGDGSFSSLNDFQVVSTETVRDIEVVDVNGDGFVDVLAAEATGAGRFIVLKNLGIEAPGVSRGFDEAVEYLFSVTSDPARSRFAIGDFDGDLDIDAILGPATGGDSLVFLHNNGDGTFGERRAFDVHSSGVPEVVAGLDYERDGDLDLVVASSQSSVDLLLNRGDGSFERTILCGNGALAGFPLGIARGPIDDNSSTDVAVLTFEGAVDGRVEVLHNLEWKPSGVAIDASGQPDKEASLSANYPNPFIASTTIPFELGRNAHVELTVFDLLGRRVATALDDIRPAGKHFIRFDASGLSSGVYFYRIAAGGFVETRRMIVVR